MDLLFIDINGPIFLSILNDIFIYRYYTKYLFIDIIIYVIQCELQIRYIFLLLNRYISLSIIINVLWLRIMLDCQV